MLLFHDVKLTSLIATRVLGPIVTAYDYLQYLKCAKFFLPLIHERLGQLQKEKLPLFDPKVPVGGSMSLAIGAGDKLSRRC